MAKRVKHLPVAGQDIKLQIVLKADEDAAIINYFIEKMIATRTKNSQGETMYTPMGTIVHNEMSRLLVSKEHNRGNTLDRDQEIIDQLLSDVEALKKSIPNGNWKEPVTFATTESTDEIVMESPSSDTTQNSNADIVQIDDEDDDWMPPIKID